MGRIRSYSPGENPVEEVEVFGDGAAVRGWLPLSVATYPGIENFVPGWIETYVQQRSARPSGDAGGIETLSEAAT